MSARGHVLERGQRRAGAVVGVGHGPGGEQPFEGLGELVGGQPRLVDLSRHGEHRLDVGALAQEARVEPAGRDGILDVVHRVGDVVGPVHDLGLEPTGGRPGRRSRNQSNTSRSSS